MKNSGKRRFGIRGGELPPEKTPGGRQEAV